MDSNLSALPTGLLVGLIVLAVLVITLDVIALRDLYRRPRSQVVLGNKWAWVAIILLVSSGLGAIIYLVAGRRPPALTDAAAPWESSSARDVDGVAEALYGQGEAEDRT
ncbi:PLD nuclease N-terminal domain-containing protein [Nocardioides sp.]|uniref:PLD nuclease N-terminal domain-containing protein n=1 Tax=Nocardioides sp. TaxID=35761 RepID=UPI0035676901